MAISAEEPWELSPGFSVGGVILTASPVRVPDNAGAIPIDRTQIQMNISSARSGLVAFIVTPPRLKPGLR
jgi:hypothetical protein